MGAFMHLKKRSLAGRFLSLAIVSLISGFSLAALPQTLSPKAEISVVTMWPGPEIYIAFGHTAFRVQDPEQNLDLSFNYGMFTLQDPFFVPKFVYGELDYILGVYGFGRELKAEKDASTRIWHEQVLNLNIDEKQALYNFLVWNAQPENRVYRYDFILDNCSTRIPLALNKILGSRVSWEAGPKREKPLSFRHMIDQYVAGRPYAQFAFYLVLGRASDKITSLEESLFLPQYLMDSLEVSKISHEGKEEALVKKSEVILQPEIAKNYDAPWLNPAFILWPALALSLFFLIRNVRKYRKTGVISASMLPWRILDFLFFLIVGILGAIVWYLTFVSTHTAVKGNLNALWLFPFHLATMIFVLFKKPHTWMSWWFAVCGLQCLIPLLGFALWPQALHISMVPFMLLISVRCAWHAARNLLPRFPLLKARD